MVCCIIHIYCIKNTRVRFQIHLKYGKMSWPSCGLRYIPIEAHRWLHTDGPLRQLWQPLIHFQSGRLSSYPWIFLKQLTNNLLTIILYCLHENNECYLKKCTKIVLGEYRQYRMTKNNSFYEINW